MLLRGERFVDLLAVTRQGLRASVESYSLKPLEAFFGYARKVDLRDQASPALRRVDCALELGAPQTITPADRYVSSQVGDGDVTLGDTSVAELMQTDAFQVLVNDANFRQLANDPGFAALARSPAAMAAMAAHPKAFAELARDPRAFDAAVRNAEAISVAARVDAAQAAALSAMPIAMSENSLMAAPHSMSARWRPEYSRIMASWIMVSSRWVAGLSTGMRAFSASSTMVNATAANARLG